jgi:hypothetical protein
MDHHDLTIVGCRPKALRHSYKWAARAALSLAARDGDCVEPRAPLLAGEFEQLFPKTNLSFLASEPGFGVLVENGTVRSARPRPGIICRILTKMEAKHETVGLVSFVAIAAFLNWRRRKREADNLKVAGELAKHAHRILATTDQELYQYDIKAQLHAKDPRVDGIWKLVVRLIEQNPHVCIGVMGSRYETYWKWLHRDRPVSLEL